MSAFKLTFVSGIFISYFKDPFPNAFSELCKETLSHFHSLIIPNIPD